MFAHFRARWTYRFADLYRPTTELLDRLRTWQPDALITRWAPGISDPLQQLRRPTVLIGGHLAPPRTVCVGVDNRRVGVVAAEHLLARDFHSFAFVGKTHPYSELREEGFRRTLASRGFTCTTFVMESTWQHYLEDWPHADAALARWLAALPRPTGLFAVNDNVAWQVLQVCRDAQLSVPEHLAVVGANNDELTCGLAHPPLSSVSIPWDRIGAEVFATVERLLAHRGRATRGAVRIEPGPVVIRQSSDLVAVAHPLLARAVSFIRQNAHRPIGVQEVLAHLLVSRRRLEQLFRQHLNRSPRSELVRVRMERAQELLRTTDWPIPRVAEACGFNYASRFCTVFRERLRVTPRAFRQHCLAASLPAEMARAEARATR